jgi:TRAP-type mannitol/chloroaromatic compound transport system permease small subunit
MSFLLNISDHLARFVERVARISSRLILLLIAVIVYDVVTRKFQFIQQAVLNSPLYEFMSPIKLQEFEWHLHAVLFLMAFGYAYIKNSHVRVDLYRETLPRRKQAFIELFGLLAVATPYLLVVMYFGVDFVSSSYGADEGSDSMTGLPNRWIIKSFLLIGLAFLLLAITAQAMRLVVYLFGDDVSRAAARKALPMLTAPEHEDQSSSGAMT